MIILIGLSIVLLLWNWSILDRQSRKNLLTMILVFSIMFYYHEINQLYDIKISKGGILISPINITKKHQNNYANNRKSTRSVSAKIKKIVASAQKWKCAHCHNILDATYEVDHIKPLCKGGGNEINNLQALCRNCHGHKTIYDLT